CDVAETCTGASGFCPTDTFASSSTKCTGTCNGNPCDGQDLCDGKGNCVDVYLPSTTVCRPSKGQCDVAESCSGTSGFCPADGFASTTTTCTGTCNGNPCDGQDLCDGKGNCVDKYLPSSTICRAAKGECDVAETCTGTSGLCPTDGFACSTTKCTGTCNGNPCDGQDFCDGKGNCVDKYLPSGTVCGTKGNSCIIPATCTGDMGFCPPDSYEDSGKSCSGNKNGGVCDGKDSCDGEGNCIDRFLNGVVCQKPVGYSRPTYCNGKSSTCPVTSYLSLREMVEDAVPATEQLLVVRSSSPMVLLGLVCAVAVGVAFMKLLWLCVAANAVALSFGMELLEAVAVKCSCNSDCPAVTCQNAPVCSYGYCQYTKAAVGTKCPGKSCTNGGACDDDANDFCNDKAECISAFKPSTTVCRPATGDCDVAEVCTGSSGSCPLDTFASMTTECKGANNGGACDGVDLCDGNGNCVDKYLPSTTVCRAAKSDCDVAESCTGTSGLCPADVYASSTTTCKGTCNGNPCDG
ncbi:hypothetical protein ACHHYP_16122, partial [Achlya hypogyna]